MSGPDMSQEYNTPLTAGQEQQFVKWANANGKMKDLYDYDLRGAWLSGEAKQEGHLPDTWKKPNHPTFSDESQYSRAEDPGGKWEQKDGKWSFRASKINMLMHGEKGLKEYFQSTEPDATLEVPAQPAPPTPAPAPTSDIIGVRG